jgi:uncharacterized damage-inducible protein DinB
MDFQKELIAEFDREAENTRKLLAAIPADADFAWKPHPKSMSLGRLAGHVSETVGDWGISTLTVDKLEFAKGHKFESYIPASTEAMLEQYDKQVAKVKSALAGFDAAKWDDNWKFVFGDQTWIDDTRYRVWRIWVISHVAHHRAQLGVFLRMLDKPIPGMYGPSADEM